MSVVWKRYRTHLYTGLVRYPDTTAAMTTDHGHDHGQDRTAVGHDRYGYDHGHDQLVVI